MFFCWHDTIEVQNETLVSIWRSLISVICPKYICFFSYTCLQFFKIQVFPWDHLQTESGFGGEFPDKGWHWLVKGLSFYENSSWRNSVLAALVSFRSYVQRKKANSCFHVILWMFVVAAHQACRGCCFQRSFFCFVFISSL